MGPRQKTKVAKPGDLRYATRGKYESQNIFEKRAGPDGAGGGKAEFY